MWAGLPVSISDPQGDVSTGTFSQSRTVGLDFPYVAGIVVVEGVLHGEGLEFVV